MESVWVRQTGMVCQNLHRHTWDLRPPCISRWRFCQRFCWHRCYTTHLWSGSIIQVVPCVWSNMAYWKIHHFWLVFTRKSRVCRWKSQRTWLFFVQYVKFPEQQGFLPCPTYQFAVKSLAILCKWMKHEAQMSSCCIHPKKTYHTKNHSWPESRLLAPAHPTMKKKRVSVWANFMVHGQVIWLKQLGWVFVTPWSMSQLQDFVNPRTSKLLSDGPFGKWFRLSQAQSLNDRILECIFSKGTWYMSNLFKEF